LNLPQLPVLGWLALALLVGAAYAIGWLVGSKGRRAPSAPMVAPAVPAAASAASSAPASRPDRATLGRYRIDREIGRGSMGTVYLGHDPQIGRPVAIKTMALSREFEGSELAEARTRFFREAEMAGRLQHRDIVTIFDANEEQGLAFIAMEFVKGHDLLQHTLPGKLLPVPVVLHTLARVATALAHAHAQGVVHRDVKPANVMIDLASGSVKVTDFGIARITDACRTRTGMVLGTPSFMSPEQMAGRRLDGRTDLYSLGVMLFQLLTGSLPHRSESMAELMYQIANETAPDVRTLRPELPETLANVVALALEKRPEVRYADGHQMASDLLEVARLLDAEAPAEPAEAGVIHAPESSGFEATAEFSRVDPRHNAGH
jgi:eukaryotic-like serine/threonine-protein kinase